MSSGRATLKVQALHGAHGQFAKLIRDFIRRITTYRLYRKEGEPCGSPSVFYINVFYALFLPGIGIGSRFSITAMNITNRTVLMPISSHSLLIGRYIPAAYRTAVTSV